MLARVRLGIVRADRVAIGLPDGESREVLDRRVERLAVMALEGGPFYFDQVLERKRRGDAETRQNNEQYNG